MIHLVWKLEVCIYTILYIYLTLDTYWYSSWGSIYTWYRGDQKGTFLAYYFFSRILSYIYSNTHGLTDLVRELRGDTEEWGDVLERAGYNGVRERYLRISKMTPHHSQRLYVFGYMYSTICYMYSTICILVGKDSNHETAGAERDWNWTASRGPVHMVLAEFHDRCSVGLWLHGFYRVFIFLWWPWVKVKRSRTIYLVHCL